jgi:ATP-dependent Clp protease ATP-binding subunit ClpA
VSDNQAPVPSPRYLRILERSAEIAREMGHSHVGVEHLFLAIINDPDAIPTQQLASAVKLDIVETNLRTLMRSASYETFAPPPE